MAAKSPNNGLLEVRILRCLLMSPKYANRKTLNHYTIVPAPTGIEPIIESGSIGFTLTPSSCCCASTPDHVNSVMIPSLPFQRIMADICSTIAGVASLIDVALRGCSVLYESINHLKDAPELSLRLRRTVQSVESILRCLDSFVVDYRKQQISTGVPSLLPDALDHELTTIKAELDALLNLLPTSNSSSQLRRRLKWVLDRKQLAEIVRRLDGHQITLILALQSFAQ